MERRDVGARSDCNPAAVRSLEHPRRRKDEGVTQPSGSAKAQLDVLPGWRNETMNADDEDYIFASENLVQLRSLRGRYWDNGKYEDYKGEPVRDASSWNADYTHDVRLCLTEQSRCTVAARLFPLTTEEQNKYDFGTNSVSLTTSVFISSSRRMAISSRKFWVYELSSVVFRIYSTS